MSKEGETEHKSIFDESFKYNKIPREVYQLRDLVSEDREILSRIIFWTRKGMPCSHTNEQFAELINKSIGTAARSVYKLIGKKYVHATYSSNRAKKHKNCYRDLTACVGVNAEMQMKRMEAQAKRKAKAKQKDLSASAEVEGKRQRVSGGKRQCVGTTMNTKDLTKAAPSPSPDKRASAPPENTAFLQELKRKNKPYLGLNTRETQKERQRQLAALGFKCKRKRVGRSKKL